MSESWFLKSGSLVSADWDVLVDQSIEGWQHTGLRVATLGEDANGQHRTFHLPANNCERLIWALEGDGFSIEFRLPGETEFETRSLKGRETVFHGTTDLQYLPMETEVLIRGTGRVIVAEAPAREVMSAQFIEASEVPVVLRGAGRETRQVHNFGVPEHLAASRFIVVEVIVPAGNWSGVPAHKHDEYISGVESNLEEIYYFESAVTRGFPAPASADPVGYFRGVSADDRPYDQLDEVRSGDVALVPNGWHEIGRAHV